MTELEKAKRQRAIARGYLTRARNSLEEMIASTSTDRLDLEEGLYELNKQIDKVEEAQLAVEMLIEIGDLQASQDEAEEILVRAKSVRKDATRLLQKSNGEEGSDVGSNQTSSNKHSGPQVRLPKLELPSFGGNVLQWQPFWDQFKAGVGDTDLPEVQKFSYLRSLLKGEAKACIDGLQLTDEHYKLACE
jgi:hypothetical protein